MAKKQKRNVASTRTPVAPLSTSVENPVVRPERSASASPAGSRSSYTQEFNPDYHLVIQDLKKISILAVSFIGLLVVLSFFLR